MLPNQEGKPVPEVTFKTRENHQWVDVTTDELFKNKKVIVFSLPGAFTPTCSSSHLPRYNDLAKVFSDNGVNDIICISVNDAFVMNEWKEDQKAEHVRILPDGNGDFSKGMGMLVNKDDLGFGMRSWRYSMLVDNGIVEKMFIEPEKPGDPFEVSDADTMLKYLNPNAKAPEPITIITRPGCPHCSRAKMLLEDNHLSFEEIVMGQNRITNKTLRALSGANTVPQVFIGGKLIGGADELENYFS